MTNGMDLIRARRGLLSKVAQGLGLTRGAVAKWDRVPAELVVRVEKITGIPRHELRGDLHLDPAAASNPDASSDCAEAA